MSPALKIILRYLLVLLVSGQLVLHLWHSSETEKNLAAAQGGHSQEAMSESWKKLAIQVESGAIQLSPKEQTERFRHVAKLLSSEADLRRARAESSMARRKATLNLAFGALAIQVLLAAAFTYSEMRPAKKRAEHGSSP